MLQILCWSFLKGEIFWYLQQKRRYDVISDTWYLRCFKATLGSKGLTEIFENQFFLKFDVFHTKNGWKVHFEQVFRKKVNFGSSINPLEPRDFSKIRGNSVSNFWLQMTIKWPKMVQMSWNKDRNAPNFMLIIFEGGNFLISPTEKAIWRHQWHMVFALL